MDSHMFDGMISGLIMFGMILGVVVVSAIWLIWHYLIPHIHIFWR